MLAVDRPDRGRRRTEFGLYACHTTGRWTCCNEYGDLGDDPVCCKEDPIGPVKGREEDNGLPQANVGASKGTSSDNGEQSRSNDPPAGNSGDDGPPVLGQPALSRVKEQGRSSESNDEE